MNLNNADIFSAIKCHGAKEIYNGSEGIMVCFKNGIIVSDIDDGQRVLDLLYKFGLENTDCMSLKNRQAAEFLKEKLGFIRLTPCSQWVYTKDTEPDFDPCGIEPMRREDIPLAAAHYRTLGDNTEYLTERMEKGRLWGIYIEDNLAGFAGIHSEGSAGMLEILPEYRRRGLAFRLESFIIARLLDMGAVPYCHVIDGNQASVKLQQKLGFERAEKPAVWISK